SAPTKCATSRATRRRASVRLGSVVRMRAIEMSVVAPSMSAALLLDRAADREIRRSVAPGAGSDQAVLAVRVAGRPGQVLWCQTDPSFTWLPFLRMRSLHLG